MKLRTVGKLGVILSVILFCIGVGLYSFARLSLAESGKDADLLAVVPSDCIGLLETDNIEFMVNEFPQAAYAGQLDILQSSGLFSVVGEDMIPYIVENAHDLHNQMNYMMVSFHAPISSRNLVMYFRTNESGRNFIREMITRKGLSFSAKKETYRGKTIEIYPVSNNDFISCYNGKGFLVVSYQKNLIEKVIDAEKDEKSLRQDVGFTSVAHTKTANFLTLYGHTASIPLLAEENTDCWSEFDIHLNSEVFYLSGSMYASDSCLYRVEERLKSIQPLCEDSVLILSGQEKVDSCISQVLSVPQHTLFDECVSNLSRDASFIMVADVDKLAQNLGAYKNYLPAFIYDHVELFRSFILSVQITNVNNKLSHIFVFTYKE